MKRAAQDVPKELDPPPGEWEAVFVTLAKECNLAGDVRAWKLPDSLRFAEDKGEDQQFDACHLAFGRSTISPCLHLYINYD